MKPYRILTTKPAMRVDLPEILQKLRQVILDCDKAQRAGPPKRRSYARPAYLKLLRDWKSEAFAVETIGYLSPDFLMVMGLLNMLDSLQSRLEDWSKEGIAIPRADIHSMCLVAGFGYFILEAVSVAAAAKVKQEDMAQFFTDYLNPRVQAAQLQVELVGLGNFLLDAGEQAALREELGGQLPPDFEGVVLVQRVD